MNLIMGLETEVVDIFKNIDEHYYYYGENNQLCVTQSTDTTYNIKSLVSDNEFEVKTFPN